MYYRGSPLAIALIGGTLKDDPSNLSLWEEECELLEEAGFSHDKFEIEDEDLTYQYPSINASIEVR